MCVAVVIVFGLVLFNDVYSKSEAVVSIVTILAISILLSQEQQEMESQ
jgi:multisubunit Na+/H+ antiporter MnhG subunit